jgi:hypothetical protein
MNLNRRQALCTIGMAAAAPFIPFVPLPTIATATFPTRSPSGKTWLEVAQCLAQWEVSAIQDNYPTIWHKLNYRGAIQYCDCVTALYGVGPRGSVETDCLAQKKWLAKKWCLAMEDDPDEPDALLADAISPCGHGFCVVARMNLSDGLRQQFKRGSAMDRARYERMEAAARLRAERGCI